LFPYDLYENPSAQGLLSVSADFGFASKKKTEYFSGDQYKAANYIVNERLIPEKQLKDPDLSQSLSPDHNRLLTIKAYICTTLRNTNLKM
jgi:hypothetical protein